MRKPDSINRDLMRVLGGRIRAARRATGATAREFAAANGYDRNLWGRIERGQQNVSLSTLHKVAAALRTPMAQLFAGVEEELERGIPDPSTVADGEGDEGVE